MTDPVQDAEFTEVFDALLKERDLDGARATVTQLNIARKAARSLIDDAADARDVGALLALLGPVVRASVSAEPERAWDLGLLSEPELLMLERLQRKAMSLPSPDVMGECSLRLAGAIDLATLLDGCEDPDALAPGARSDFEISVRACIHRVLSPTLHPAQLYSYLTPEDRAVAAEFADAQAKIVTLEAENSLMRSMLSGKVTSLATARRMVNDAAALAQAPIVKTSSIDALSGMVSDVRPGSVGDHPGHNT